MIFSDFPDFETSANLGAKRTDQSSISQLHVMARSLLQHDTLMPPALSPRCDHGRPDRSMNASPVLPTLASLLMRWDERKRKRPTESREATNWHNVATDVQSWKPLVSPHMPAVNHETAEIAVLHYEVHAGLSTKHTSHCQSPTSTVNETIDRTRKRHHVLSNQLPFKLECATESETFNLLLPSCSEITVTSPRQIEKTLLKSLQCPTLHDSVARTSPTRATSSLLEHTAILKSKSLVRNRHDEIDWVATFLKVGFEPSSIYALICPLRKGRWKTEEETYTLGLLRLIENGTIHLRHGQSIRGYIGEKLHSDSMRVFKKLSNCKMFHFAKLIQPRLASEKLDMSVKCAWESVERLKALRSEFLRAVQLEALVAVRKYLSDNSLQDQLNSRA